MMCLTAFRRTAGLCLKDEASLEVVRCGTDRTAVSPSPLTPSEKSSGYEQYGTGSLVTREGSTAFDRWRRRLYELVCAYGSGKRPVGKRPSFGSATISQELDPAALRRARSLLLASRDAGSTPDRSHRAHRDAMRGACEGNGCTARYAPRRAARWSSRARIARDRDRAGGRQP